MARPLRIVHVLRAPMGGLFRHVRDLAMAHQADGHQVAVVCDAAGTAGYNEPMAEDLSRRLTLGLHRAKMQRDVGVGDLLSARNILKIIKELKPDVLHGHGAKGGVYARALGSLVRAERSRVARLYSPHGGSLHYDPSSRSGQVYFRVERMLERVTDRILFVADYERKTYVQKIGEPGCPWTVNHNGLNDEEFEPVTPDDGAADFLFLGEFRMLKGPDIFLEALASLRSGDYPDASAVMVGDGPDTAHITAMTREFGLDGAVSFRPPMPARRAFALGRTFIMPSRAEALPYVVLEALGAGMPVIATGVGGIPEILGADNPALAEPEAGSLAALMETALAEPAKLRQWMPAADLLRKQFSVRTMAGNALAAYRSALSSRLGGDGETSSVS